MPISSGSQPATAKPRKVPSGFRPFFSASFALITTQARSAIGKLARVAGRDVAAFAHRLERREAFEIGIGAIAFVALQRDIFDALALVFLSTTFFRDGSGTISSLKRPACWPLAVRRWLSSEYSSCASRLTL